MDSKITFALKAVTTNGELSKFYGYYSGYTYSNLIAHRRTKWSVRYLRIRMCERGWHVVLPYQITEFSYFTTGSRAGYLNADSRVGYLNTYLRAHQIWLVAVRGNSRIEKSKAVFGQMKFLSILAKNCKDEDRDKLHKLFETAVAKVMANPKYYGIEEGNW